MQLEDDEYVELDESGNIVPRHGKGSSDFSNLTEENVNKTELADLADDEANKSLNDKMTVTVNISCHKLLGFATENLRNKIPNEGYLLTSCQVQIDDDDTVYDVLRRVCEAKGMNYSASKGSFGVYVSSIDNLSDSVVGKTAGWCYFVNGNFAKVSASKFKVDDGQTIDWEYDDNWDAGVLE